MTDSDEAFDPDRAPYITWWVIDSTRPDAVCTWVWWGPTPDWDVAGELVRQGAALALRSLRIVPHASLDGSGDDVEPRVAATGTINPAMLKRIPLGRLLAQVNVALSQRSVAHDRGELGVDPTLQGRLEQWRAHVAEVASAPAPSRRRGRPPLSDDLLRRVAVAYIEGAPDGPGVTARLAEDFGVQRNTMRDYIRAARAKHWLGPGAPGSRNATPGWRLLDDVHADVTGLEGTGFDRAPNGPTSPAPPTSDHQPPF